MRRLLESVVCCLGILLAGFSYAQDYTLFESQQIRPLAMSPDGNQLFVVNTPDNRLEIFAVSAAGLEHTGSVPVGLEPVAVAARSNSEVWVVNHLSDSVSIVSLVGQPRVTRTLLVGDEPRSIVFAGAGGNRAFISAAHRGQNSPYMDPDDVSEATQEGIGRADIWVFDAANPGAAFGGAPLSILELFGDSPGALAVSADGNTVYASVFKSGNQTTPIGGDIVCDGGASAAPCAPVPGELLAPGGVPSPNEDQDSTVGPEVGLIVKYDGAAWRDELNRDWSDQVRFNLPDLDVFKIDVSTGTAIEQQSYASVGTVLFGMVVDPSTGNLYVSNTEARNEIRFLGERTGGSTVSTLLGRFSESRITVIDTASGLVEPRHLNKHIDYSVSPAPVSVRNKSLSMPSDMAISSDGSTLYVAAIGSGKIGVFDVTELADDSFVPDAADHIQLTGGGPTGVVLDEARDRLYVLTRFDNTVSIVDTNTALEGQRVGMFNPEPASVVDGRPFLFDAAYTSSNGEVSCASCHIAADKDELAWDLGDPFASVVNNPNVFKDPPSIDPDFHPLKGPMLTQTLRGISTHGPLHFRGDATAGNDPGGAWDDAEAGFQFFNGAFVRLMGRSSQLTTTEFDALTAYVMQLMPPPNPNRNLDNSFTATQQRGFDLFFTDPQACLHCHVTRPGQGLYGTSGKSEILGTQAYKITALRNVYERVGMFGRPETTMILPGDHSHMGDQVRGYGYFHDGSQDTLFRYNQLTNLAFPGGDQDRLDVEQFQLVFVSNLKPVVGQQATLNPASNAAAEARVDLLVAQAAAGDADLVVKGIVSGESRGWYMSAADTFSSDQSAESTLTESQLRTFANQSGQELTFTAVPLGSGTRVGIDRDRDTVLDGDDNCPAVSNPTQDDADADQIGDACEDDTDGDGMSDEWENEHGLDMYDPTDAALDGDADFLINLDEFNNSTDPNVADSDGDWIKDGFEVNVLHTNPNSGDTDSDTLPDFWEAIYFVGPADPNSVNGDPDGDGFTNIEEHQNGTHPRVADIVNDPPVPDAGLNQTAVLPDPVQLSGSAADDGLPNPPATISYSWSVVSAPGAVSFSASGNADTEVSFDIPGVYVLRLTADDSLAQASNDVQITMLAGNDSDGDGMPDTWEVDNSLNPFSASDADADGDADLLSNLGEFQNNTDPYARDSDGDWISDGHEVNVLQTNPNLTDTDGDTMPDRWEAFYYVDPINASSASGNPDGDAYTNLEEYNNGTHPRSFDP